MPVTLPVAFLVLQFLVLFFLPSVSGPAAYISMVAGPLLAAGCMLWRARLESGGARLGWRLLALALGLWGLGAFVNLWQEWILGHSAEMYRESMLAFAIATVPTTYLLASDWRPIGRYLVRSIDALIALTLGYAYFLLTWSMIAPRSGPQEAGTTYLIWLLDAQNLYIAACSLIRWYGAEDSSEANLFRSLSIYALVYLGLVFYNDHFLAGDPAIGPELSSAITISFALLATMALRNPEERPGRRAHLSIVRSVRSASPMILAGALLIIALALIRIDYSLGAAGILISVFGYGLRNTVTQVSHIEREDSLQKERTALRAIAWTDALTGVPNRHFLDEALKRAWRTERHTGEPLAVLMIDLDYFKLLNDRYGHSAGDACLRDVARVLQQSLVRAHDVFARFGGEEFIALLRDTDANGAQAVGERLRGVVEALRLENLESPLGVVTVSVGVTSAVMDDTLAPMRLVELADKALYEAKRSGRNQVRYLAVVD
ncbi:MAG: GGDEF domain-containing protein [Burkholderiaceae bacterium]